MSKAGLLFHRVLRATRALGRAFKTGGSDSRTITPRGRSGTAWDRPDPNPWPRCVACHRRVAGLCVDGCGVCPACCPGHEDDENKEAS